MLFSAQEVVNFDEFRSVLSGNQNDGQSHAWSDDIAMDLTPQNTPAVATDAEAAASTAHATRASRTMAINEAYSIQSYTASYMNVKLLDVFKGLNRVIEEFETLWNAPTPTQDSIDENAHERAMMRTRLNTHLSASSISIPPQLITYAEANHPYERLSDLEKVTLCIARLQSINLKYEAERAEMHRAMNKDGNFMQLCCTKCYKKIYPRTKLFIPDVCTHLICDDCIHSEKCNHECLKVFNRNNARSVRLRYNVNRKAICRECCKEFTEESIMYLFECGDACCYDCYDCFGRKPFCLCGKSISSMPRPIVMIAGFN